MFADSLGLDDGVLFYLIGVIVYLFKGHAHLAGQHIGEEAQPSHVHAKHRNAFGTHAAGRIEEGAVAAERDSKVGSEVLIIEDIGVPDVEMLVADKELIVRTVDEHLRTMSFEDVGDMLYGHRLPRLKCIAEEGKA